ncbi:MAG: FxsA family protein [Sulfuricurvum sp.]|jgi:2-isopropylmalate synthase/UPF0716 protein FxsA
MIYFLVYLFLEVLVSVSISSSIGVLATFFELLLSALVGFIILINFRATLQQNFASLMRRNIDVAEFEKLNLFTILGAFLLILPGFLSDIIGILLQFSVVGKMFVNRYNIKSYKSKQKDSDVIDVEVIERTYTKH